MRRCLPGAAIGMLKHLQRTTFTAKCYGRGREESVHLFLFIIYQMEAVIPIEHVLVIFSGRRVFARFSITLSYNTGIIYCMFVDQL